MHLLSVVAASVPSPVITRTERAELARLVFAADDAPCCRGSPIAGVNHREQVAGTVVLPVSKRVVDLVEEERDGTILSRVRNTAEGVMLSPPIAWEPSDSRST